MKDCNKKLTPKFYPEKWGYFLFGSLHIPNGRFKYVNEGERFSRNKNK